VDIGLRTHKKARPGVNPSGQVSGEGSESGSIDSPFTPETLWRERLRDASRLAISVWRRTQKENLLRELFNHSGPTSPLSACASRDLTNRKTATITNC